MASYWVSQERYFCKYCKVWLSKHQASIRNHDQGKKHQAIVEEFFRKKREDKLKGASSESDLKRQMDQIEKAALQAIKKDQELFGGAGAGSAPPPPPPPPPPSDDIPPPPPPPRHPLEGDANAYSEEPPPPPPPPPGRPPGIEGSFGAARNAAPNAGVGAGATVQGAWEEGGQWYLHGQARERFEFFFYIHQAKLAVDSPCQMYVTSEGQWVDAIVLAAQVSLLARKICRRASVPSASECVLRRFKVAYFEVGAEKETVVSGVQAPALRIPAGEGGAWPPPLEPEAPLPPPPPPPPADENTGLGGWQTVSVRLVDEAAEAETRRLKKEAKKERKRAREDKSEREKARCQKGR
ncbi:unnamed protein product [Ascophyllum nodosum]